MKDHNHFKTKLIKNNASYGATNAQKSTAETWFATLRDQICRTLETLEGTCTIDTHIPAGRFERKSWARAKNPDGTDGGGGTMSIMRDGRVFEKVGVNISTVHGTFSEAFRGQIPGADKTGDFWASGLSLVAHPRNPHVPPIHMNTRHIVTEKAWFGAALDLNPITPNDADTAEFHTKLKTVCDAENSDYYPAYKAWCDDYFYLPHRNEHRGIGGIFYDYLNETTWDQDFAFTQNIGKNFTKIYCPIVERHMNTPYTENDRAHQLMRRGRYAEFNLIYDRGTTFGLKTGGNPEAILMSLPPLVAWP